MAFDRKYLSGNMGAGGKAPKLFTYATADAKATVVGSGYFNDSSDVLEVGDMMMAATSVGGTIAGISIIVKTNTAGVVTTGYIVIA